ncbi:hypothetical protein [Halomonas sp.]|uniref:hypothetical protein n=1 Tax=Halomonas sp. TaxID=1486246 RepID=UPI003D1529F6
MTTTAPLTRPSTRLCPGCQRHKPHGQFSATMTFDHDPQRWHRAEFETCQQCRMRGLYQAAPGRPMQ